MPEITVNPVNPSAPSTPVAVVPTERPLVHASIMREKGKAIMTLDCRGLHTYLSTIGVVADTYNGKLLESAPGIDGQLFDTRKQKVSGRALCVLNGSASNAIGSTERSIQKIDLATHWTAPLRPEALETLLASVNEALIEVLTHYQPVELSLTIKPKAAPVMVEETASL